MADILNNPFPKKDVPGIIIKRCPHCGSRAGFIFNGNIGWKVQCRLCGCGTLWYRDNETAARIWNKRGG